MLEHVRARGPLAALLVGRQPLRGASGDVARPLVAVVAEQTSTPTSPAAARARAGVAPGRRRRPPGHARGRDRGRAQQAADHEPGRTALRGPRRGAAEPTPMRRTASPAASRLSPCPAPSISTSTHRSPAPASRRRHRPHRPRRERRTDRDRQPCPRQATTSAGCARSGWQAVRDDPPPAGGDTLLFALLRHACFAPTPPPHADLAARPGRRAGTASLWDARGSARRGHRRAAARPVPRRPACVGRFAASPPAAAGRRAGRGAGGAGPPRRPALSRARAAAGRHARRLLAPPRRLDDRARRPGRLDALRRQRPTGPPARRLRRPLRPAAGAGAHAGRAGRAAADGPGGGEHEPPTRPHRRGPRWPPPLAAAQAQARRPSGRLAR